MYHIGEIIKFQGSLALSTSHAVSSYILMPMEAMQNNHFYLLSGGEMLLLHCLGITQMELLSEKKPALV